MLVNNFICIEEKYVREIHDKIVALKMLILVHRLLVDGSLEIIEIIRVYLLPT